MKKDNETNLKLNLRYNEKPQSGEINTDANMTCNSIPQKNKESLINKEILEKIPFAQSLTVMNHEMSISRLKTIKIKLDSLMKRKNEKTICKKIMHNRSDEDIHLQKKIQKISDNKTSFDKNALKRNITPLNLIPKNIYL